MSEEIFLTISSDDEVKKDYRKGVILNYSVDYRNGCELRFACVDNSSDLKEILECVSEWCEPYSTVYLEENHQIEEGKILYKKRENSKMGVACINSISSLTDKMMHSLSKVAEILVIPKEYLQDKNFHKRISLACWMYFVRTYIIVPKNMSLKEREQIAKGISKNKLSPIPQFDITPDSKDIKREFKIRRKHIYIPIFEMSGMFIVWIVGIPLGLLGLLLGGIAIAGDGIYSGIRYLHYGKGKMKKI